MVFAVNSTITYATNSFVSKHWYTIFTNDQNHNPVLPMPASWDGLLCQSGQI